MIRTKVIYASFENYGTESQIHHSIDANINKFIEEEQIDENRLIDIKYAPVGFFQENNGEGELEGSALIIYKK